ncbi:MAG: transcriptional regulator, partial [Thermoflexus sp.]
MGRRVVTDGLENRVAQLRQERGWSQGELARRAGLSRQALS